MPDKQRSNKSKIQDILQKAGSRKYSNLSSEARVLLDVVTLAVDIQYNRTHSQPIDRRDDQCYTKQLYSRKKHKHD